MLDVIHCRTLDSLERARHQRGRMSGWVISVPSARRLGSVGDESRDKVSRRRI
jgi:hypothetical protein